MNGAAHGRPVAPGSGRHRPLSLAEVEITGGFWGDRQEVNSEATIAHCHDWMERLGWVGNFTAAAAGTIGDAHQGVVFTDSDVYKLMEAAAWERGRSGSSDADDRFNALTEVIAPTQEPDGYLNTVFGRPGQPARYSDLEWGHELYCFGHMLQAAVARAGTAPGTPPRWSYPDPRIDATRGCVAVERGPIVMCLESVDLPDDVHVDAVQVDPEAGIEENDGTVTVSGRIVELKNERWPYRGSRATPAHEDQRRLALTPYQSWGNSGPSTMRVWMPVV
jgi:DUF1680 family protein